MMKDGELALLRTRNEELELTLRSKEEDIAQLSRMKAEAAARARQNGDSEVRVRLLSAYRSKRLSMECIFR